MAERFRFIGETEALRIAPGATVELEAGGHVTPLARDTLRARRITVVAQGVIDAALPDDLAPVSAIARVAIGADHTGVAIKQRLIEHLRRAGKSVDDLGTNGSDPVDYPDFARAVGLAVVRREADAGILIDGAGLGSAMAANKIRGVRAAMCQSLTLARYAREHAWMSTPMREPRYIRRLLKIRQLEREF